MNPKDLIIGERYVPHQKTAEGYIKDLKLSRVWQRALKEKRPYLYYNGVDKGRFVFGFDRLKRSGDFFNSEDVTPYIEPKEEVSGKDLTQDARDFLTKKYGADFKNNKGFIKGANFWEGIAKEMVEFANIQKEQNKALQESHDKLLEALISIRENRFAISDYHETIENAKNYAKK